MNFSGRKDGWKEFNKLNDSDKYKLDEIEYVYENVFNGGTLGCSAGLCIQDDTCNDDVDDSDDEYTDDTDEEDIIQVKEPTGVRRSERTTRPIDFFHKNSTLFIGAIRLFFKKKSKQQKAKDLSDVEKVFAESKKSNTYLRFLIITKYSTSLFS